MMESAIPAAPSFLLGVLLVVFCSMVLLAAGFTLDRIAAARGNLAWFGLGCVVASVAVLMTVAVYLRR